MPSTPGVVASAITATPQYYRSITVDNTSGSAKTDWPVLVSLTSANFTFAHAQSTGYDILFRANDGVTTLPSWRESYDSSGQTAAFWVTVPSVPSNSTVTIRMYFGNAFITADPSSLDDVFVFGEDFRNTLTAAANIGGGSLASNPTQVPVLGNYEAYAQEIALHGGTGWRQNEVREQSNIVWTGTEFVILITGSPASGNNAAGLFYASAIEGPWTEYSSNPVLPLAEDPYICVTDDGDLYADGSGWHYVMFERKQAGAPNQQLDIGTARTKNFRTDWEVWDGSAWTTTVANHAITLAKTAAAWDQTFTGSPTVLHDGSQFVCIYEGASTTNYQTGVARSADAVTWTKEASNPILSVDVIDDVVLLDGTWWATFHGDAGNQFRYSTTDAPSAWSSTSFTTVTFPSGAAAGNYELLGQSVNLAFGFDGSEHWATYQDGIGTRGIRLFNWLGGTKWDVFSARRRRSTLYSTGVTQSGYLRLYNGVEEQLNVALASVDTVAPASNFAIRTSKRATKVVTYNAYSNPAFFGTGVLFQDQSQGYSPISFGYHAGNRDIVGGEQFTSGTLRRYSTTATAATSIANGDVISDAESTVFAVHELRYRSTGALDYRYNNTSKLTATDSTYVTGAKRVGFSQGSQLTGALYGGGHDVEWFLVRPFDGVDPACTVGSEVAA